MIQVLYCPGWFPAPLNSLLGHPMVRHRHKRRDAEVLAAAALAHQTRRAEGRRRVDLHLVVGKGQRRWDEDGLFKSVLDGLVRCGLLVDDSPRWCAKGRAHYSRSLEDAPVGTLILLEDLA